VIVLVIAAIVVVVLIVGVLIIRGGSREEPGVVSFRKHIDALSPEARREVLDRVRPQPPDDEHRPQG
jgi:preprotein translocase subunit SecG